MQRKGESIKGERICKIRPKIRLARAHERDVKGFVKGTVVSKTEIAGYNHVYSETGVTLIAKTGRGITRKL